MARVLGTSGRSGVRSGGKLGARFLSSVTLAALMLTVSMHPRRLQDDNFTLARSWRPSQPCRSRATASGASPASGARELALLLPGSVAVIGATGKLGREVVSELLANGCQQVIAISRDLDKAKDQFAEAEQAAGQRLKLLSCDAGDGNALAAACEGADAAVWCVSGGAGGDPLSQFFGFVEKTFSMATLDERGLKALGELFVDTSDGPPKVVMVSSAAVTRPMWSEEKKQRLPGCADIPIVRLNPDGILDKKVKAEDVLRESSARYSVVRPVGLKDEWRGRPVLTQGDVAVGRISRADLAKVLVELLVEPEASGKTFEVLAVAGYPANAGGYGSTLATLRRDDELLDEAAVTATYHVLQQLLPGEKQDSAGLAMGQTYEQIDVGEVGRLGKRGEEVVPSRVA
ncbi:unnamed protein product [Polarella glacialis]|uniref:NAD(P)-binding domain-containing protein n=1 Tax=Polarella glacialis TaxID=89957 RepID=A0A813L0I3_POLGL|nr:unnamed protein product [Polarella glacialis]CAE8717878.1 unnamed protein product [Polarella glacialis]